jgi:hypothetical protein
VIADTTEELDELELVIETLEVAELVLPSELLVILDVLELLVCKLLDELELTPGKLPESDLDEPPPQAESVKTMTETSALWRQTNGDSFIGVPLDELKHCCKPVRQ